MPLYRGCSGLGWEGGNFEEGIWLSGSLVSEARLLTQLGFVNKSDEPTKKWS